jgi:hypothetical protein
VCGNIITKGISPEFGNNEGGMLIDWLFFSESNSFRFLSLNWAVSENAGQFQKHMLELQHFFRETTIVSENCF